MAKVLIKNLFKSYVSKRSLVEAVKDLNLDIEEGEFVVFLGPSGCGKTSTLRMIAGLEKITGGEIFIGERLVNDLPPNLRNIAMAFETYALYSHMSIRNNLSFCLRAKRTKKEIINQKIDFVSNLLDINDILDKKPSELSGGQLQRVSLGRALIREPDVFLLDEPLSHLDFKLRFRIRAEIKKIHHMLKTTMIYVTHDQIEALALADKIAIMSLGMLQQYGTVDDLFDKPKNIFVATFLGEPSMNIFEGGLVREADKNYIFFNEINYKILINDELQDKILKKTKTGELTLGIRPKDLFISNTSPKGNCIEAEAKIWEFIGEKCIMTTSKDDKTIVSIHNEEEIVQEGETVKLKFNLDKLHIFDKATGESIHY